MIIAVLLLSEKIAPGKIHIPHLILVKNIIYIALNIFLQFIYLFASKQITHIKTIFTRQHARHMNANLCYVPNK